MAFLNTSVYDNGLGILDDQVVAIHICTALPGTYAEATSTYNAGVATSANITVNAPSARGGGGREVVVSAITAGSVTTATTATVSHVALVGTTGNGLLAARALATTQTVTNGNPFTLTSFTIGIPGVAT